MHIAYARNLALSIEPVFSTSGCLRGWALSQQVKPGLPGFTCTHESSKPAEVNVANDAISRFLSQLRGTIFLDELLNLLAIAVTSDI